MPMGWLIHGFFYESPRTVGRSKDAVYAYL
jgi:hypothetical protein